MATRLLANLIMTAGGIVARSFMQAYQQALKSAHLARPPAAARAPRVTARSTWWQMALQVAALRREEKLQPPPSRRRRGRS